MLNRRYTVALESLGQSTKRLAAAEEKINALRIEQLRNEQAHRGRSASRPGVHVSSPKPAPKK